MSTVRAPDFTAKPDWIPIGFVSVSRSPEVMKSLPLLIFTCELSLISDESSDTTFFQAPTAILFGKNTLAMDAVFDALSQVNSNPNLSKKNLTGT